jgi:hypothetical protein
MSRLAGQGDERRNRDAAAYAERDLVLRLEGAYS